jgi:ABC-type nitrate/sulfonate/bicarbonate transport system substrate-binding protein
MKPKIILLCIAIIAIVVVVAFFWKSYTNKTTNGSSSSGDELTVAISPYQDIAMLVNAEPLGLTTKYGVRLNLITMAWEDILPAVASAGKTVDVGFGSLTEYLTKYSKLNEGNADPILFVQPLYVYNGGGFVALDPKIKPLDAAALKDPQAVRNFLNYRIGAQKQSIYEMMIFTLAHRVNVPVSSLKVYDMPLNDGLLALQSGSLDVSAAGLTQVNEAEKRNGRMVLSMEDSGFADVTGFIVRKSTLDAKRAQIENLIRIWFDCVNYVMKDPQNNSTNSLAYLRKNAATQYTYEEYSNALSQEYFPRSLADLQTGLLAPGSKYDFVRLSGEITDYLIENKIITSPPPVPTPLLSGR